MKTLFLAWQDPNSGSWFPIGRLTFDGTEYQFAYTHGVEEAQAKCDFQLLQSFPRLNEVYKSNELFPLFSNRLMPRSRPDYNNFVQWLNVPKHKDDPIALLARSGGRKATDHFEVFPCPEQDENGLYHIHFFVHRLRELPEESIIRLNKLKPAELLYLAHDLQNEYDTQALMLRTNDRYLVGYCPRYLVEEVWELLRQNQKLVHVHVERVNLLPTPLQFRLLCNMTAEWHRDFRPFSSSIYQPIRADFTVTSAIK